MARAPFETRRGGVGAVVIQGGRNGPIARERVTPTNPQTERQQNQRNILGTVASEWRGLSAAVRLAWATYAAMFGSNLTGFGSYVKTNATRLTCGQAKLEEPPALPPAFGVLTVTAITADASAQTVAVTCADTVAPDKFMVFASAMSSPAGVASPSFRFIKAVDGFDAVDDIDIGAEYVAKFGEIQEGQLIQAKIVPVVNGIQGVGQVVHTLVVAQIAAPTDSEWDLALAVRTVRVLFNLPHRSEATFMACRARNALDPDYTVIEPATVYPGPGEFDFVAEDFGFITEMDLDVEIAFSRDGVEFSDWSEPKSIHLPPVQPVSAVVIGMTLPPRPAVKKWAQPASVWPGQEQVVWVRISAPGVAPFRAKFDEETMSFMPERAPANAHPLAAVPWYCVTAWKPV